MKHRLQKRARRGVTLVEVLIVVAIMAAIAGAVTLVAIPEHNRSRVRLASISAGAIKEAAQMWRTLDDGAGGGCPSVQDLVQAKKLDPQKVDDPWGSAFRIVCDGENIHVVSPGRDRKPNTPDDVREAMRPAEIEAVASM